MTRLAHGFVLLVLLMLPAAASAQAVAVVDVRFGIADPPSQGSLAVAQNVDFGLVTAPQREEGLSECRYAADPDKPVLERRSDSNRLQPADPAGGCQFLTGAPQPGIVDIACESASSVTLRFTTQTSSSSNRIAMQFTSRGSEFLKVNGNALSTFDGQCVDGRVQLALSPTLVVFNGALPTGGSISLGTIRIEADFS